MPLRITFESGEDEELLTFPDQEAVAYSFLAVALAADEQEVDVRIRNP